MKGQISIEAIIVFSIVAVVFAAVLALSISKQIESNSIKESLTKQNECNKFSNSVHSAFVMGDGASVGVRIYTNISVEKRITSLNNVFCTLCCNVTRASSNIFNLTEGWVKIKNKGGELIVEQ